MKNETHKPDTQLSIDGQAGRGFWRHAAKYGAAGFGVALAVAVSGCAGGQQKVALDRVGPAPTCAATPADKSATGSLVVFTPCESIPLFDAVHDANAFDNEGSASAPGYTWDFTGYKILTTDGKKLRSVHNNVGKTVPHPEQVELAAGHYCVVADATGYGRINVPVEVVGGRTTVLHLEEGGFWPGETAFSNTNSVRLPNGRIIGWRAADVIAQTP